ncbi:hypothetical protein BJV82DRAFT_670068 [Fennellomyces sp. T-0311]|nr:hypothetical protein BJV82DRAFT_670068 [Fennellomyces sp. T-0311]
MQKRSSTIQPRPTKASMLRQQGGPLSRPASAASTTTPAPPKKTASKAQASEGIRAFMATQRAVAAQRKKTTANEPKDERPKIRVMTGAERYSYNDSDPFAQEQQKPNLKLQTLIRQAKSSGKLNISNRDLDRVPDEVWSMYHVDPNKIVVDFSSASDDAWYDQNELTKFIAADNNISEIDERIGQEFGALTTLDFRNNRLEALPNSLSQLQQLTVLHLSHNQLSVIPPPIFELSKLRDLDLSHNQLKSVPQEIERLSHLEILNLNDNGLTRLADGIGQLAKLRKLYLNQNSLVELPVAHLLANWKRLDELHLFKNQLRVLFRDTLNENVSWPSLTRLDVRQNSLTQIIEGEGQVSLPKLKELLLAYNQLSQENAGLELVVDQAPAIQTLDLSSNLFSEIPDAVLNLEELQRLDVSSNHLRLLRPDLGKLQHLAVLSWEGNPLRSAPRNVSMAELIESLRSKMTLQGDTEEENKESSSAPLSPPPRPVLPPAPDSRASGTLDLSQQKLTDVDPEMLTGNPATLQLHHNALEEIPQSLNFFAATLVHVNLDHNRLKSLSLTSSTVFQSLKTLSLSNNRIAELVVGDGSIAFPQLVELNVNINALTSLPENLSEYLPSLRTLKVNTNRIDKIHPTTLQNLQVIDLGNNDIAFLPPEIGQIGTIRELILYGNRFRIPRPAVLDQGTGAVLEFLRRRLGS